MNTSRFKPTFINIIGISFFLVLLTCPDLREHAIHILKQPVSGWLLPFYF